MLNQKLTDNLKEIGLDEKEIKVYTAAFELGEASAAEIAQRAKIERVNTYYILGLLKAQGLVSEGITKTKKIFLPTNPSHLVRLAESRLSTLNEILPELLSIYNTAEHKPKIQFFEGKEGLAAILDDILETCKKLPEDKKEILEYTSPDSAVSIMKAEQLTFIKNRIKNKIRLRWIVPETDYARTFLTDAEESHREMRFVDPASFPLDTELDIYGDKMAIFGSKEHPLGVIIEHKEMVKTQRQIFELAWKAAEAMFPQSNNL